MQNSRRDYGKITVDPDRGGVGLWESANVLTADGNSPSGGMVYNTGLVEVEKL